MNEIWKDIIGFEGRFKISNCGNVMSINGKFNGEKILMPNIQKTTGYKSTTLRWNGRKVNARVHVLVAQHFKNKKSLLHTWVNHEDGDKLNNNHWNLEWVTPLENCQHAVKNGLHNLKGERHPHSKLTNAMVYAIKFQLNYYRNSELATVFKMSRRQIRDIRRNINWVHIRESFYNESSLISNCVGL